MSVVFRSLVGIDEFSAAGWNHQSAYPSPEIHGITTEKKHKNPSTQVGAHCHAITIVYIDITTNLNEQTRALEVQ